MSDENETPETESTDLALPEKKAQEEVTKWLDFKKVSESRRDDSKGNIKVLVEAISKGHVILNEDMTLTHKLLFPIEDSKGSPAVTELKYKPRIKVETVLHHLQGVKAGDADGRVLATLAAVAGKSRGLLVKMDSEDYSISQAVVVFFL